ncbi:MAG: glycosyltransferase family 39 protein [Methanobrevibacter sp.]|nr:glycosyltransferase family 39 protein [Methanobrevibacter sp.]
MFEEFNIKQKDKYCLIFIAIFSIILVGYYINFNNMVGISCSDVYVYLLNALYYTGTNIHSTENIYLSPIICFLTSICFMFGFVDKLSIFIITGIFAIFGNIGCYLLFKKYFDETLSLTGTVLYSTFSLCLTWLGNGTLDIPATGLLIWIALFTIIAVKENPKFYEYLIPLFVIGFFTRYTVILTLPAFLLFYVYENGFKIAPEDFKHIKRGIIIGVVMTAIILAVLLIMGQGQFQAGKQISNGIIGKQGADTDPAYNLDISYYVMNLPNFISNSHTVFAGNPVLENPTILSWAIFAIMIIGAGFWLYDNKPKFERKHIIPAVLILIAIITFTRISSVLTTLLVLISLYLIGKDSENKDGFFMLAWIFSNIIFLSYYSIKVNRYIIPIFPPMIFFILTAIESIHKHVKINKNIIPVILIALFLIQGFAFTYTFEPTNQYTATEDMSNFLIEHDPNYKNEPIGVYNIRPYSWWLGETITGIVSWDQEAIDSSNVTYYISNQKLDNLTNYTEIKQIEQVYLYEKSV